MSDWKTLKDRAIHTQVEVNQPASGAVNAKSLHVRVLGIQVEHTGGEDDNPGVYVRALHPQIEYDTSGDKLKVRSVFAQIEYTETYPTSTLSRYQPRILVDMWLDTGVQRFSTEDLYIEEI